MALIGLHGRARAGKDSVGDLLCRRHGYSRLSFAGPLKDGLIAMFGLQREQLVDRGKKEQRIDWLGKSPRELMQLLGTEFGRQYLREDIWITLAARNLRLMHAFTRNIVITDARFENEAAWIRRMGGQVWHVYRTLPANVTPLHASEAGLPIVVGEDSLIDNSAGLEQLAAEVERALAGQCLVEGHPLGSDVH